MQSEIMVTAIKDGDSFPLKLWLAGDEYHVMGMTDRKGVWKPWFTLTFKSYPDFEKHMNEQGYYVKEKSNTKKTKGCNLAGLPIIFKIDKDTGEIIANKNDNN